MTSNSAMANPRAFKCGRAAFTLIEVLVAMLFMVVVIPVALGAMRVASMAGESAQRKLVATRIANKIVNDLRAEHQLLSGAQRNVVQEDGVTYTWSQKSEFWSPDPISQMYMATIMVEYPVAGRRCNVQLSTLVPPATQ